MEHKEFIEAIERQKYFTPNDEGSIYRVWYVRRRRDESGKLLDSRYAYFFVFAQPESPHCAGGRSTVYLWAKKENLRFAIDGTEFIPELGDEISVNCGMDWENVNGIREFSEGNDGDTFFMFIAEPNCF